MSNMTTISSGKSSVYPEELAEKITEAWVECRQKKYVFPKEATVIAAIVRRKFQKVRELYPNNPGEILGDAATDN